MAIIDFKTFKLKHKYSYKYLKIVATAARTSNQTFGQIIFRWAPPLYELLYVRSFVCSFVRLFICSFVCSFVCTSPPSCSFVRLSHYKFVRSYVLGWIFFGGWPIFSPIQAIWNNFDFCHFYQFFVRPPPIFRAGGSKIPKIISDQFSRHFRQFWTTLIF